MALARTSQPLRRPGFEPRRLADLCHAAVDRCNLDLVGRVVATEAATGAYATTAVLAALGGASVRVVAADSRHGSAADALDDVCSLARFCGVADRITVFDRRDRPVFD